MKPLGLFLLASLSACGYQLAGTGATVPPGARTIGIQLFKSHVRETGLEVHLRRAVEEEFRRRGALRVVPPAEADLVLSGDIRRFTDVPVAFSATDEAVQYQTVVQVGIRLIERATGHVLHETKTLQESQDFGAETAVVITSSPRFQRGTIDGRDLANLTNVQIGEARRQEAETELLDTLARDIYEQAMEGF
ncbi:MAG: hypothetical protein E6J79_12435 [Deltaproteobacteria bacterium]|nr:MAG: hypothetical protein E6J79_12435 [Deltaproteobacteria bacterium]